MTFDSTRYYQFADSIYKRVEDQYELLTNAEKTFFLIDWLDSQVHNGGWHQWYHNWKDNERRTKIEQTVHALQEINAIDTIILLQEAVKILDQGAPCDDVRLGELNEAHWAQPDDLGGLTLQWAEERIREFKLIE